MSGSGTVVAQAYGAGEHFIDICYIKDGSVDSGQDVVRVKVEIEPSPTFYSNDMELDLGPEKDWDPIVFIPKCTRI